VFHFGKRVVRAWDGWSTARGARDTMGSVGTNRARGHGKGGREDGFRGLDGGA